MQGRNISKYKQYLQFLRFAVTEREDVKLYLELFLTLGAITFFVLFAIRPTVTTILALNQQIESQRTVSQKLEQKLANLAAASANRQEFEENKIMAQQAIPDGEAAALATRQLEALAARSRVNLQTTTLGRLDKVNSKDAKDNIEKISISAAATGTPEEIFEFLSKIGKLRRPILWETLQVAGRPAGAATTIDISFAGALPFVKKDASSKEDK